MEVLNCTDKQKVCYATFKITVNAKCWWLSMKRLKGQRYFPSSTREEKVEEFTNLTQGNMIVREYAATFMELSHFAPFMIPNEARKVRMLEKGLRRKIYELVVGFHVQNFSELVDKASVLEKSL
ncbi:uncharacterized protein LOC131151172 [Malania oleifera]|uniref:uncharacterized protein LOC131151172 n=1 Tax=Malania oleifera TaxID=397392 RepID=UPI0025AE93FA|nr:uncharacterized protein LOC131151172 [Malania oleifera]